MQRFELRTGRSISMMITLTLHIHIHPYTSQTSRTDAVRYFQGIRELSPIFCCFQASFYRSVICVKIFHKQEHLIATCLFFKKNAKKMKKKVCAQHGGRKKGKVNKKTQFFLLLEGNGANRYQQQ